MGREEGRSWVGSGWGDTEGKRGRMAGRKEEEEERRDGGVC